MFNVSQAFLINRYCVYWCINNKIWLNKTKSTADCNFFYSWFLSIFDINTPVNVINRCINHNSKFLLSQPTSSYGVPPVQIADEDIRPRGTSGKRPPVFGYYPPAQRVMPRVNRKFFGLSSFFTYTQINLFKIFL